MMTDKEKDQKRHAEMVMMLEGKMPPKKKRYVDDEEFAKMKGKTKNPMEEEEGSPEEEANESPEEESVEEEENETPEDEASESPEHQQEEKETGTEEHTQPEEHKGKLFGKGLKHHLMAIIMHLGKKK